MTDRDEQLIRAALEMAAEASTPAPQGPEPTEFAAGCRHALLSANARIRAITPAEVLAGLEPAADTVAGRPCADCGQTHDTEGDLCPTCVCVRAEIAAMEADHD